MEQSTSALNPNGEGDTLADCRDEIEEILTTTIEEHMKELGLTSDMPQQLRELQSERDKLVEANRHLVGFVEMQGHELHKNARMIGKLHQENLALRQDRDIWAQRAHHTSNEYAAFRQGVMHLLPLPSPPANPQPPIYRVPQHMVPSVPMSYPMQNYAPPGVGAPVAPAYRRRTHTMPAIMAPTTYVQQSVPPEGAPLTASAIVHGAQPVATSSSVSSTGSPISRPGSSRHSISYHSPVHGHRTSIDLTDEVQGQSVDSGSRKRRRTSESQASPLPNGVPPHGHTPDSLAAVQMSAGELVEAPPAPYEAAELAPAEEPEQDTSDADEIQSFIDMIFEADENDEDKIWCKMCRKRYSTGNVKEPPTPFTDADVEELMKHCELEHPMGYARLKATLAAKKNETA
ncbi:hypothetical protein OBBRIDRAFT_131559 [Obba rivulosa]|uniref:Uncharacterized protein n=1 Tax=Obba rivulosa TaxID=1052685 RepID=A0A8E2DH57_9APHY|nr:hypothetical protein OBBRIDRAFT_131559 [Obba rivulosa]